MKRIAVLCLWIAAVAVLSGTAFAAPTAYRGAGTVTRVARDLGAVMIAHDPVPELHWPAMNMTFGVRSDSVLQNIEVGDRIDFVFLKSGENYIITSIDQPKGESHEAN